MIQHTRRGFLGLLGAAVAAPAIIKTPGLLMPVRSLDQRPVFPVGHTLRCDGIPWPLPVGHWRVHARGWSAELMDSYMLMTRVA